jgi:hypothetical protein
MLAVAAGRRSAWSSPVAAAAAAASASFLDLCLWVFFSFLLFLLCSPRAAGLPQPRVSATYPGGDTIQGELRLGSEA